MKHKFYKVSNRRTLILKITSFLITTAILHPFDSYLGLGGPMNLLILHAMTHTSSQARIKCFFFISDLVPDQNCSEFCSAFTIRLITPVVA